MNTPLFTTQPARPVQNPRNGRWSASFKVFATRGEDTYLFSECESAPLFETEMDAWDAGERAIEVLDATGEFPNMCEPF